jgi:phenylpyruvate tautomerase PptA (4-oxalocrotonate tautomerase family)
MPLYRCTLPEGLTTYEQRSRIAREVTRIHCDVTGAPPTFVHTFFAEDHGAALPDGVRAVMFGSIRAGRTAEQKQQLVAEMTRAIADVAGLAAGEVVVATVDVPARWVMEGGAVMPEPGEEADWLAKHG